MERNVIDRHPRIWCAVRNASAWSWALLLAVVLGMVLPTEAYAQCNGTATTAIPGSRLVTSTIVTGSNTTLLSVGMPIQGTGIAAGAVVASITNATTFVMSLPATATSATAINLTTLVPNATWQPATVPAVPVYTSNFPPVGSTFCAVCPSLFTVDLCGNQYARMYMCAGNLYTVSMCPSATSWNSTISITGGTTAFPVADGFTTFDDDGCGTPGGHAQLTYTPTTSGVRFIRILSNNGVDPCIPSHTLCGTLSISCATIPPPPANDNPCGAQALPVNPTCTSPTTSTTSWSTATSVPPPVCGVWGGYDVWYSAVVPASGALAIQTNLISATDLAMAVYAVPSCTTAYILSGTRTLGSNLVTGSNTTGMVVNMLVTGTGIPAGTTVASIINGTDFTLSNNSTANITNNMQVNVWPVALSCNADIAAGVPDPFIAINDPLLAGQTVYIRVWPQSGPANGGNFEICAFEPTPPVNDNPCSATSVPVTPACTPVNGTTEAATVSGGAPVPACGNVPPINDVWFTVQIPLAPAGVGVEIDLSSSVLNDAAMAVYRMNPDCNTLAAVSCSDPAGATMPGITVNQNGTTIVAGTILYVRVWNKTGVFGNFQICATPTTPPPNDDPCGAIALPVNYGCLFSSYSNENASITPTNPAGVINVPNPTCAATATADVWFTVQVPNPFTTGALFFDSDDGSMTDGAFAIYRVASGTCGGSNLVLTQLACTLNGSPTAATMPSTSIAAGSLVPGETLYIRMWRQTGSTGTFSLCASRTDAPPGNCNYTLRMNDSFGDGWAGSFVTVCINPPGPPPNVCTNYSIIGSTGSVTFGANVGAVITVSYTAASSTENQISFLLLADNSGQIAVSSTPLPTPGVQTAFIVDANCNRPPAPIEDCIGSIQICADIAVSNNPQNTGSVVDLTLPNRGCLIANERRGVWYNFTVSQPGQVGFTIDAFPYGGADYDYGLWGPYSGTPTCPPTGPPLRCSWGDGPVLTGLNWTATDFTEGAAGDSWTRYITANAGDRFLLFVDNFYTFFWGTPFNLTFQFQPGCVPLPNTIPFPCASIACPLPVELLAFNARPQGDQALLTWSTGSEENSAHWVVERSANGVDFVPLGQVNAAGNSAVQVEYNFPDRTPLKGWNYYRLKQVDKDAGHTYSEVRTVLMEDRPSALDIYPNPANDLINVLIDAPEGDVDLRWSLLDASLRQVAQGGQVLPKEEPRMTIPVDRLDGGTYLVVVRDAKGNLLGQARFVKQ